MTDEKIRHLPCPLWPPQTACGIYLLTVLRPGRAYPVRRGEGERVEVTESAGDSTCAECRRRAPEILRRLAEWKFSRWARTGSAK